MAISLSSFKSFLVEFENATRESITGTSTKTPTTVAKAAPEFNPNRDIATATASSKKLDAPIIAAGEDILCGRFSPLAAK